MGTITTEDSGAVFIYQREPAARALRNFIEPNVLTQNSQFGASVAFGDDGKVLAASTGTRPTRPHPTAARPGRISS